MHMKCIMPFPNHTCQYITYTYINKIYIHATCYLIHINNIKISSLELITIHFQWLTHNYIFIKFHIMLTHLITFINILLLTQFQAIQFKQYFAYEPFPAQPSKPGLFLTVPKQAVGCPLAAHSRNPWPFSAKNTQTIIYCINYHTTTQNSP